MLCIPWLMQEVALVEPEIIVTLGNVALKAFMGKTASVGKSHGNIQQWHIDEHHCDIFPLYHPASIIYNQSLQKTYDEDLHKLAEVLHKAGGVWSA